MEEIWENIEGYEGLYQVSNFGRIKSLNYNHTNKEKIRKLDIGNKGYLTILLCKNGEKKKYSVHRIVANTFIKNSNNLPQVNHKNGIKTDNRVCNLEWCTNGENEKHAYKLGLKNKLYGKANGMSKAIIQYDLNYNILNEFETIQEAHKKTTISVNTIIRSCKNITKRHNKFIFKYKEGY